MTISELLVAIRYMGPSKVCCLTTLRLFHDYFIGETTTIGYDYSRICYYYSSRNATTIADLYWLSGESPKRDTAVAVNGSAPPAAPLPLDCPAGWSVPAGAPSLLTGARSQAAGLAWSAVCCTVWHGSITGARLCTLIYLIIIGRLCWPV